MGKKLIERIKYWSQILLLPVYWFSFLIPRDKNIWVFGSTFGRRFADNPKYFYLYVVDIYQKTIDLANESIVKPMWISENKEIVELLKKQGYPVCFKFTFKGILYCLRGGVYLYDNYPKDISHWLSGGAIKINLWHGIPLKKIQFDNIHDYVRHPKNFKDKIKSFPRRLSDEKPNHYILTTSFFMSDIFKSAFQTEKVLVNGYPRTDAFCNKSFQNIYSKKESIYLNRMKNTVSKYKVLYMPTFRDSETKFFDVINLDEFQCFLKSKNILLCVKLHCKSKLRNEFEKLESESILVIDPDTDPYIYIEDSDLLITDYSSIYFDYLLTKKPIIFFCYDLELYLKNSREMYFDYDLFTPGMKATNGMELMELLSDIETLQKITENDDCYDNLIKRLYSNSNDNNSQELYAQIVKMI